jgi:hypothetical protein|tara:strand:- start:884 stop:1396 length:513 start_codon:yes stop_codon:yes gene_type:complete
MNKKDKSKSKSKKTKRVRFDLEKYKLKTATRKLRRATDSVTLYKKKKHTKIVKEFLEILNMIKLYHWKTYSYATHQATDELHKHLSENIDQFVEVLMGKTDKRIALLEHHLKLYDICNSKVFLDKMMEFRQFLVDLERTFDPRDDSDLFTIRDEMIVHINQFLYLLTMKK